ncbi:winged helix-turn-helix transcriptional regulator [Nocardia sp. NPDC127526]|uniref:winged helix-turn-helix transcriptional regulator n=1 Tax=Nocardia sp. NPDC127526 TaxID=3345393 RepID=UPI00363154D7
MVAPRHDAVEGSGAGGHVDAQVSVRVDYAITPLGASLMPVLRSVREWAEANMDEVLTARESFDTENTVRSGNAARS